ncbi:hypothetical protein KPH14_012557 [Odynerus spinipes]|uniref:Uncharacterized protein n=1 Tax=Odynerus spinipes TaxID=1348599 RepID=A0AAD9RIH4_9HYME|nr:hypothetical protein KPH14_012557 [Odynerus spinipes]
MEFPLTQRAKVFPHPWKIVPNTSSFALTNTLSPDLEDQPQLPIPRSRKTVEANSNQATALSARGPGTFLRAS